MHIPNILKVYNLFNIFFNKKLILENAYNYI